MSSEIALALSKVTTRVQDLSKAHRGDGSPVRLVAVSKTKPNEDILEAYKAGHRHFGENYVGIPCFACVTNLKVNELVAKSAETNKVKKVLSTRGLWMIETVDSEKLAKEIDKFVKKDKEALEKLKVAIPLNIFVQVKTSDEDSKTGVEIEHCVGLVDTIINTCDHLKFKGLMTIGKLDGDPRDDFEKLSKTRKVVCDKLGLSEADVELSMGMSSDYEVAIEMGSTNVRVGSTIFGHRERKVEATVDAK